MRAVGTLLAHLVASFALLWAAGALYFDLPAPALVRCAAAIVWFLGSIVVWFFVRPHSLARLAVGISFVLLLGWWFTLQPRQDRDWKPEVAVLAHADIDGDRVTIHNVRNFDYRTETDFTPRYDTRTYDLRQLRGIDLFICYWGSPWMAHPIASFAFARADGSFDRICFSIETRPKRGESYSAIGGFYRQFELIYIPADERDVVRLRTNFRQGEDVYCYRLKTLPGGPRKRFLEYVAQLNALHDRPRWYNAATTNCTTSIRAQHDAAQRAAFDWRMLLNGKGDELLYEKGALDRSLPFAELKQRAHINARAKAAHDAADFSELIRVGMPRGQ